MVFCGPDMVRLPPCKHRRPCLPAGRDTLNEVRIPPLFFSLGIHQTAHISSVDGTV